MDLRCDINSIYIYRKSLCTIVQFKKTKTKTKKHLYQQQQPKKKKKTYKTIFLNLRLQTRGLIYNWSLVFISMDGYGLSAIAFGAYRAGALMHCRESARSLQTVPAAKEP